MEGQMQCGWILKMADNFSKLRCRETAAVQRLLLEMPEHRLALMTRIATILVSDNDGSSKLRKTTDSIYGFEPMTQSDFFGGRH